MRILFVRHGEPDYARDCLTEEGARQAAAAAERLAGEGIRRIYASPCGRARETAAYTARRLGLPVEVLPFMRMPTSSITYFLPLTVKVTLSAMR